MARNNLHTCHTCGQTYYYCHKCMVVKPNFAAEEFCSKAHQDIFEILSKHGCHLATAEETLAALKDYDTTHVTERIAKHIETLIEEAKREVEHDEPTQE